MAAHGGKVTGHVLMGSQYSDFIATYTFMRKRGPPGHVPSHADHDFPNIMGFKGKNIYKLKGKKNIVWIHPLPQ